MNSYALSLTLDLPDCINVKDFIACNLQPVVVLTDFMKSHKKVTPDTPPATPVVDDAQTPAPKDGPPTTTTTTTTTTTATTTARTDSFQALTPPRSTPSPVLSTPKRSRSIKRKRSWDASTEYEVEKIVGYHRDKREKMWYLVKWKNWSRQHNTFEPIENLTGCHLKLMKYFEVCEPTREELRRMNSEVKQKLRKRDLYRRMVSEGFTESDREEFSRECLDLKRLFEARDLEQLENEIRTEYMYILRCLIGMYQHQDPGLFQRAQKYKLYLKLAKTRRRQVRKNAEAEKMINSLEKTFVRVENNVDLEVFPDVKYILEMRPGKGGPDLMEPLLGCECPEGCSPRSQCCGKMADSFFAYRTTGKLRSSERFAIYECNSRCRCPPTCPNRVVQRGRQVKLCIFKTESCGWGVKALERIPRGAFVCEYVGELIPDSVAVVRDLKYFQEKKAKYLFDLDFFIDAQLDMYCIDATEEGNLARFINHSCDPNLVVYPVWIENLEPNIHRLAFFAKKNIQKGEEIHFDYENLDTPADDADDDDVKSTWGVRVMSSLRCKCNAANCRQWVFGNK